MDFKKAFGMVWHTALWTAMRMYNSKANLIRIMEHLYDKGSSAVFLNGTTAHRFNTTVVVRKVCLLSPSLQYKSEENHDSCTGGTLRINGHRRLDNNQITPCWWHQRINWRRTGTILVERTNKSSASFGMEISTEKINLMKNDVKIDTTIKGEKVKTI